MPDPTTARFSRPLDPFLDRQIWKGKPRLARPSLRAPLRTWSVANAPEGDSNEASQPAFCSSPHQACPCFSACRLSRLSASSPILPVYDIMYSHLQMWSISNRCYGFAPVTATPGRRVLSTSARNTFLLRSPGTKTLATAACSGRAWRPARGESGQSPGNGLARWPFQMYPACQRGVNTAGRLSGPPALVGFRPDRKRERMTTMPLREVQGDNLYEQIPA